MATPNRTERGGRNKAKLPKNGDRIIKEGNEFVFNNGNWSKVTKKPHVRKGQGSPKPETPKTPQYQGPGGDPKGSGKGQAQQRKPAEAKPPKNGDTTIKEGNKFVYKDGKWTKVTPTSTPRPTPRPAAPRPATPAAPKKPAAPASPKDRRVSAATANRESGNYGTSRTNNPMIDDAMKARMRQREERAGVGPVKDGARYAADVKNSTQGVGPVKDGERYASNLKPANKNKPAEKGMTLAERMRKRRQGLA